MYCHSAWDNLILTAMYVSLLIGPFHRKTRCPQSNFPMDNVMYMQPIPQVHILTIHQWYSICFQCTDDSVLYSFAVWKLEWLKQFPCWCMNKHVNFKAYIVTPSVTTFYGWRFYVLGCNSLVYCLAAEKNIETVCMNAWTQVILSVTGKVFPLFTLLIPKNDTYSPQMGQTMEISTKQGRTLPFHVWFRMHFPLFYCPRSEKRRSIRVKFPLRCPFNSHNTVMCMHTAIKNTVLQQNCGL